MLYFRCSECGGMNRVSQERLQSGPKCGRCGNTRLTDVRPVDASDELAERLTRSPVPVLVDFWAPWCGPCRTLAPHVESLASRHAGKLLVVKVNTQQHPRMAQRLGVQGIPTLVMFRDGKLVDRAVGALPPPQLDAFVQRHVG